MFVFLMLSSDINVKNLTFTPYCAVGMCVWGGSDQDVITIQTSPFPSPCYRLQFHVPTGVGGGAVVTKCISLLEPVRLITIEMSTDAK